MADLSSLRLQASPTPQHPQGKPGLYVNLYHGRRDLNADMGEWGSEGPTFGPYEDVHLDYGNHLRMQMRVDENTLDEQDLYFVEDLVWYDGVWYGGVSVLSTPESPLTAYSGAKSTVPEFEEVQTRKLCPGSPGTWVRTIRRVKRKGKVKE